MNSETMYVWIWVVIGIIVITITTGIVYYESIETPFDKCLDKCPSIYSSDDSRQIAARNECINMCTVNLLELMRGEK